MKKALIIFMALAMVFAAFADGPDVTPTVTSFKGDATLGYKINLQDETLGMYNGTSTELKIQWIGGSVEKATEGSGLWGELKIKADGKVEKKSGETAALAVPTPTVETAKIHINDMLTINILKPDLSIGKKGAALATGTSVDGVAAIGTAPANAAGFTAEVTLGSISANIKFADNGIVKADNKDFGFAADTTIKPIDGLTVYAGATFFKNVAFAVNAEYAYKIDDTFTFTPWAAMTFKKDALYAAGFLLGWGGADLEPSLDYVPNKTKDGVSFAMNNKKDFVVGAFDSVFLKDTGLKAGFDYKANLENAGKGTLNLGVKGAWDVDVWKVEAHAGYTTKLGTDNADSYKYGVAVSNNTIIANTTLKASYEGAKKDKGTIDLSAKISF